MRQIFISIISLLLFYSATCEGGNVLSKSNENEVILELPIKAMPEILSDDPPTKQPDEEYERDLKKGDSWKIKMVPNFSNQLYWVKFKARAVDSCGLSVKCSLALPCEDVALAVMMSPEDEVRAHYCTNDSDPILVPTTMAGPSLVMLFHSGYSRSARYDCTVRTRETCPIETTTTTTTTSTTPKPSRCQCGDSNVNRIIHGSPVQRGEIPWQVGLQEQREGEWYTFCGGALVSDRHVITATHCIRYTEASTHQVQMGVLDRGETGVIVKIKEVIPFSERYTSVPYDGDVTLLLLKEAVDFTQSIYPVCLPPVNTRETFTDRKMTVSGWGNTEMETKSDILLKTTVVGLSQEECIKRMSKERITDLMLCAVGTDSDSCQGDSGGPLTFKDNNGVSFLAGVVSWGDGCNTKGSAGVYARIVPVMRWFEKQTEGKVCTRRMSL